MSWSNELRASLRQSAEVWATREGVPYYRSLGSSPTVLFERAADDSSHGNFHPSSWRAMLNNPNWKNRLSKPHSQRSALPEAKRPGAVELDSSNSSDALLMNCFCFPDTRRALPRLLGLETGQDEPVFGYAPRVALADGQTDATEIDMRFEGCIVEAKLTEGDFTSRHLEHIEHYQGFHKYFEIEALPRQGALIGGYQLIRNVLAAAQHEVALVVLLDARRPDLLHEWWQVHGAIRDAALRRRCSFRTWQEVAHVAPTKLASFLAAKYGL